jgi:hypothetical protein
MFRFFLEDSPRHWPKLVHICRRWRRIVFASHKALHLRLLCTHGTPVQKNLDFWPASLHIALEYGGSAELVPPAPEDDDNIIAALKLPNRVTSISLTVTKSLLGKLSAIERPFSKLEDLVLLSRDTEQLTLPRTFRWGPRLRSLHLTRIRVPHDQRLYSSRNLVDIRLHDVSDSRQLPPEALANVLSRMAQLRSLSLNFLSTATYLSQLPRSGDRVVLPALTHIKFQGYTNYLERLVARIDTPLLREIEVTFFHKSNSDLSKLRDLTNQIGGYKSHLRADILCCRNAVSISMTWPGDPTRLAFQSLCEPLSEQQLFMAQIFNQPATFLFNLEDLRIRTQRPWREEDASYSEQWLELINSFTGVKWVHIDSNLLTDLLRTLQLSYTRRETVLPALHKLCILQSGPRHASLTEAVASFMASRRLSGHHMAVEFEQQCHTNKLGDAGTVQRMPVLLPLPANIFEVGPFCQQVTTEMLPDDVFLNIFRYCLNDTPHIWPSLARVSHRWRQIVMTSPLGLNLRLHCTHGTPVLEVITCWTALPIVVLYGGVPNLDPPAPEDDENIITALKQSNRVSSISLTVTRSLVEKLSAISEPLSELEDLVLLSQNNVQPTLPSTFRWGPRLRTLYLTRVAIPSFPQLLSPCQDLVDLHRVGKECF